jgi:hypothetical protein
MPATPGNALNIKSAGIAIFDGTATFSATTTTQYNTLVGNTNNTIANISPGTTGWVLTSQGNASNPVYAALPAVLMPWTDEAISFNAMASNGYFISAVATATLPAGTQGATISFIVDNAAALTVQAAAGDTIRLGTTISAAAGKAVNNFIGDAITLVYRLSDTSWIAREAVGTWTIT